MKEFVKELFNKNKNEKMVDISSLNNVIRLSNNILKMFFVFLVVIGLYGITLIFKEWKIFAFLFTILKVLSPFFIGLIIAWLLEPGVKFLQKQGINRILGTSIIYLMMLGVLYLVITTLFPILLIQINDFISALPSIGESVIGWLDNLLERFREIKFIDVDVIKEDVAASAQSFVSSLTTETPAKIVSFIRSFISAIGVFAIGLMVGFYLLFDFDSMGRGMLELFPRGIRKEIKSLFLEANSFLFSYVKGTLLVSFLIFVATTLAFNLIGLKAALLLGFICGVTNIIPYIGPYIGGIPPVIVGFSQSIPIGILTLLAVFIAQFIESNFIQPIIMSKTMKLHPLTILLGLLIFGYFFGIIGMIVATPLIATIKSVITYLENKYNILKFNN